MTKTLEEISKLDPNELAAEVRKMAARSAGLRRDMQRLWRELHDDIRLAAARASMRPFEVQEKLDAGRVGMMVAVLLGQPREALDAGRRAAGLMLLGDDGEPL